MFGNGHHIIRHVSLSMRERRRGERPVRRKGRIWLVPMLVMDGFVQSWMSRSVSRNDTSSCAKTQFPRIGYLDCIWFSPKSIVPHSLKLTVVFLASSSRRNVEICCQCFSTKRPYDTKRAWWCSEICSETEIAECRHTNTKQEQKHSLTAGMAGSDAATLIAQMRSTAVIWLIHLDHPVLAVDIHF